MVTARWSLLWVCVASCGLNPAVLYRCADADPQCQPGATCWLDGYCHPVGEEQLETDGGGGGGDAGTSADAGGGTDAGSDGGADAGSQSCPSDPAALCANIECGFVDAGCDVPLNCDKWCVAGLECGVITPNVCETPHVCMPSGWCWENPLPLGMSYQSIAAVSDRAVWLAGEDGVAFFDGEKTSLPDLGLTTPTIFYGVAAQPGEVWLVGSGGRILHFDGTSWAAEEAVTSVGGDLHSVLAVAPGAAIAVGDTGRVLFRFPDAGLAGAKRWVPADAVGTTADLLSVVSTDAGTYALTRSGQVLMRTGLKTFGVANSISLMPGEAAHALGARGTTLYAGVGDRLVRADGAGGWATVPGGGAHRYLAFANDGDSLWLAGPGVLQRLDSVEQFGPNLGAGLPLAAVATLRRGEVLAGGTGGALVVGHADGGVLPRSVGSTAMVTTVCGSAPGALYAGGLADGCNNNCRPRVWARTDFGSTGSWALQPTDSLGNTTALTGCFSFSPTFTFMTGNDTKYYHPVGGTFSLGDFGPSVQGTYLSGWGAPDAGFFFARQGKTALVGGFPGAFTRLDVGSGNSMNSVSGVTSADWIAAVGDKGTISERDKNHAWSARQFGATQVSMKAISANQAADGGYFFVAAGQNVTWTRAADGGTFEDVLPGVGSLSSAWSSKTETLWVAGTDATGSPVVVRRNPGSASWGRVPLVSSRAVFSMFGLDLGAQQSIWVAGDGGMILRLSTP